MWSLCCCGRPYGLYQSHHILELHSRMCHFSKAVNITWNHDSFLLVQYFILWEKVSVISKDWLDQNHTLSFFSLRKQYNWPVFKHINSFWVWLGSSEQNNRSLAIIVLKWKFSCIFSVAKISEPFPLRLLVRGLKLSFQMMTETSHLRVAHQHDHLPMLICCPLDSPRSSFKNFVLVLMINLIVIFLGNIKTTN